MPVAKPSPSQCCSVQPEPLAHPDLPGTTMPRSCARRTRSGMTSPWLHSTVVPSAADSSSCHARSTGVPSANRSDCSTAMPHAAANDSTDCTQRSRGLVTMRSMGSWRSQAASLSACTRPTSSSWRSWSWGSASSREPADAWRTR